MSRAPRPARWAQYVAAAAVGIFLGGALGLALPGCKPALTPADRAELDGVEATLAHCRAVGRDAGSYDAYEACKRAAGLRADGGI